jgi:CHASE2 domain-containing sensor protein
MTHRFPRLSALQRKWLGAVLLGLAYEVAIYLFVHVWHLGLPVALENWAFDSVMRLSAGLDTAAAVDARGLTLIDIDDATWRSPNWAGGEPGRAPRKELATLIDAAFHAGAQQVVLDVLVEEREGEDTSPAQTAEREEDRAFADALRELGTQPYFGQDRFLILARSLRERPAAAPGPNSNPDGTVVELRRSERIDAVIEQSQGRIALGAPYFHSDADGVVRGWKLFRLACGADLTSPAAAPGVLPSVQLLVYARNAGLGAERRERLTRLPAAAGGSASAADACRREPTLAAREGDLNVAYWRALRSEFCGSPPSGHCPLPARLASGSELGNRLIFRWVPHGPAAGVKVLPALDLLGGPMPESMLREVFQDRIVVIAQTFRDSGDRHATPLGEMSGGWVLLNAIHSINRWHVVEPPAPWVVWSIVGIQCMIVGWFFAIWDSLGRILLLGTGLLLALLPLCYFFFRHGVWLDFAFPILGVMFHRLAHRLLHHRHSRHPGD